MEVREIGIHEAGCVAVVVRAAFAAVAEGLGMTEEAYPRYSGFERAEGVESALSRGAKVFGLYEGEMMIGTVRCWMKSTDAGEIGRLAVLPAYRGRGYGAALVARAEEALQARGAERAELTIVRHFARLEAFYVGLGYTPAGDEDYDFFPFNGRKMSKELGRT